MTFRRALPWALLPWLTACIGWEGMPPEADPPPFTAAIVRSVVADGMDYFPTMARSSTTAIQSPDQAYAELVGLYPDLASRVDCWAQVADHFVFSLSYNPRHPCLFLAILHVKIDGRRFRYFYPHT
jgi:hypothetical protein